MNRLRILAVVGLAVGCGWPHIQAASYQTRALLGALHAPGCDPQRPSCDPFRPAYPPEEWPGNEPALQASLTAFEKARVLDPGAAGPREHTAELAMALRRDDLALSALGPIPAWSTLRSATWVSGQPYFHLAASRARESAGALRDARAESVTALRLAKFRFAPQREREEISRVANLSEKLAQASAPTATGRSDAYTAVVDAACAGDWASAMRGVAHLTRGPDVDRTRRTVLTRLSAFSARLSGDTNAEAAALQLAGPVEVTQWTAGDPYLWLGKTLALEGLDRCSPGPLAIYERHAREHPNAAQGPYLEAELYYWRGDMRRAAASALEGLRRQPGHLSCAFLLVLSYEGLEEWASAEVTCRAGLKANPTSAVLWARLGLLLQRAGQFHDADAALERAIALNPSNAEALVWRGVLAIDLGDTGQAQRWFEQALAADPGNQDARQWLTRLRGMQASGSRRGPR